MLVIGLIYLHLMFQVVNDDLGVVKRVCFDYFDMISGDFFLMQICFLHLFVYVTCRLLNSDYSLVHHGFLGK